MLHELIAPLDTLLDLHTFPIDRRGTAGYDRRVATARNGLREVGCAVLRDFVRPDAVAEINAEINARKDTSTTRHR